jgi:hypothetical protein
MYSDQSWYWKIGIVVFIILIIIVMYQAADVKERSCLVTPT